MRSGSQQHRLWVLGFFLAIFALEVNFVRSSTDPVSIPASSDADRTRRVALHSSLRHRRRETAIADEAQRRDDFLPSSPRIIGGREVPNTRIADGTDASSSEYPYFILWGGCGATLIHNDIALSAAHCSRRGYAQVGARNRNDLSNVWTAVSRVKRHPDYDDETYDYDFAVLKLNGWFQLETVRLNGDNSEPSNGDSLTILGFGGTADTLQEGEVEVTDSTICGYQWQRAGYTIDSSASICTESNEGVSPCTGDSGGPLMSSNVQVGVISSGSDECDGELPSIYSRVSVAKDWIENKICELSQHPPKDCPTRNDPESLRITTIRVDIHLDDYPEDIRWRITTTEGDDRTILIAGADGFEVPNSLESRFVDLRSGADYEFIIEDTSVFQDGLGTTGRYEVVTVNSRGDDEKVLVSGGVNFRESESATFVIGDVPEPSPRPISPTRSPITSLNKQPTMEPTKGPTKAPVVDPTMEPTKGPTKAPVADPTKEPTKEPTKAPVVDPTMEPTKEPTKAPVVDPTMEPTKEPTIAPVRDPSSEPTVKPSGEPTRKPTTDAPTSAPTRHPTMEPTKEPVAEPTEEPTREPTVEPTKPLTNPPTDEPTSSPISPTSNPTKEPTPPPSSLFRRSDTDTSSDENAENSENSGLLDEDGFLRRSLQFNQFNDDDQPLPTGTPSISSAPTISPMPTISAMPSDTPTISPMPTTPSPTVSATPTIDEPTTPTPRPDTPTVGFILPRTANPTSPSVLTTPPTVEQDTSYFITPRTVNPTPNPSKALGFILPRPLTPSPTISITATSQVESNDLSTSSGDEIITSDPNNTTHTLISTPSASPMTASPSVHPTDVTLDIKSLNPSAFPSTKRPSDDPTDVASDSPTSSPSVSPTSKDASDSAIGSSSSSPTDTVSLSPTGSPLALSPSSSPIDVASDNPTDNSLALSPSSSPTDIISNGPTDSPSGHPTTKNLTDVLSNSPTEKPSSSSPTRSPTDRSPPEFPSISPTLTNAPSTSPSISASPSVSASPTTSASPTDIPSISPSSNSTETASDRPSISPSASLPTKSPTKNPSTGPTVKPTWSSPTEAASNIPTIVPSVSPTRNPTAPPSTRPPTRTPTASPTERPTVSPTKSPSDVPTITINRYLGYVSITILENPEAVSWRIINPFTEEQFYEYNLYTKPGTYRQFLNLETGIWQFELHRESPDAAAEAIIGNLNMSTGDTITLGEVSLATGGSVLSANALFRLT